MPVTFEQFEGSTFILISSEVHLMFTIMSVYENGQLFLVSYFWSAFFILFFLTPRVKVHPNIKITSLLTKAVYVKKKKGCAA